MSRRVSAALVVVGVVVLCGILVAACGAGRSGSSATGIPSSTPAGPLSRRPASSDPASPLPSPVSLTQAPAAGAPVSGDGYLLHVPPGWRDVTTTLRGDPGVDRAAGARRAQDGFNSNVNVVVTRGGLTAAQVATVTRSIRDRIRPTAPSYAVLRPVLVAGEPAGHLAGLRSRAKPPYWLEQFVVAHGSHAYVISFSFSPRVPAPRRRDTIGSVLASWSWR